METPGYWLSLYSDLLDWKPLDVQYAEAEHVCSHVMILIKGVKLYFELWVLNKVLKKKKQQKKTKGCISQYNQNLNYNIGCHLIVKSNATFFLALLL